MRERKVRNTNIEVLRFILMAFILLWHIIVHGYNLKEIGAADFVYKGNMPLSLFLSSLTLPATYCFVFISGYFGIQFRLKQFFSLLLWCVMVSVGITFAKVYLSGIDVGGGILMQSFFPIASGKWWFMTAYIQLFLLTPFLNYGMEQLERKAKIWIMVLMYCALVSQMIIGFANAGSSLMGVVFMYLLGRYFKEYGIWSPLKTRIMYGVSFSSLFLIMLLMYYISNKLECIDLQKNIFVFMGFVNPMIVIMAICLFFFVLHLRARYYSAVNKILSANIFLYLITEGTGGGRIIYTMLVKAIEQNIWLGICSFCAVMLGCLLVGFIIQQVTRLLLDKCVYIANR